MNNGDHKRTKQQGKAEAEKNRPTTVSDCSHLSTPLDVRCGFAKAWSSKSISHWLEPVGKPDYNNTSLLLALAR